ncbi:hypothetical protein GQ44DRAFT_775655 [Phaeosphaeriaceae sp. PMI808]|nr:hypothetical protein GQ44DRAFT_775655 [Phaeosphaeriaceae sp. PMI808]
MSLDPPKLEEAKQFLKNINLSALLCATTTQVLAQQAAENGAIAESLNAAGLPDAGRLTVTLRALTPMHAARSTSILYATPHDETQRLVPFVEALRARFVGEGWDINNFRLTCRVVETKTRLRFGQELLSEIAIEVAPNCFQVAHKLAEDSVFQKSFTGINLWIRDGRKPREAWEAISEYILSGKFRLDFEKVVSQTPRMIKLGIGSCPLHMFDNDPLDTIEEDQSKLARQAARDVFSRLSSAWWKMARNAITTCSHQNIQPEHLYLGPHDNINAIMPARFLRTILALSTILPNLKVLTLRMLGEIDPAHTPPPTLSPLLTRAPVLRTLEYWGCGVTRRGPDRILEDIPVFPMLTKIMLRSTTITEGSLTKVLGTVGATLKTLNVQGVELRDGVWGAVFSFMRARMCLDGLRFAYICTEDEEISFEKLAERRAFSVGFDDGEYCDGRSWMFDVVSPRRMVGRGGGEGSGKEEWVWVFHWAWNDIICVETAQDNEFILVAFQAPREPPIHYAKRNMGCCGILDEICPVLRAYNHPLILVGSRGRPKPTDCIFPTLPYGKPLGSSEQIFIPSIPTFIQAMWSQQVDYAESKPELARYASWFIRNLTRYLYLEVSPRRHAIVFQIDEPCDAMMEEYVSKYRRKSRIVPLSPEKVVWVQEWDPPEYLSQLPSHHMPAGPGIVERKV